MKTHSKLVGYLIPVGLVYSVFGCSDISDIQCEEGDLACLEHDLDMIAPIESDEQSAFNTCGNGIVEGEEECDTPYRSICSANCVSHFGKNSTCEKAVPLKPYHQNRSGWTTYKVSFYENENWTEKIYTSDAYNPEFIPSVSDLEPSCGAEADFPYTESGRRPSTFYALTPEVDSILSVKSYGGRIIYGGKYSSVAIYEEDCQTERACSFEAATDKNKSLTLLEAGKTYFVKVEFGSSAQLTVAPIAENQTCETAEYIDIPDLYLSETVIPIDLKASSDDFRNTHDMCTPLETPEEREHADQYFSFEGDRFYKFTAPRDGYITVDTGWYRYWGVDIIVSDDNCSEQYEGSDVNEFDMCQPRWLNIPVTAGETYSVVVDRIQHWEKEFEHSQLQVWLKFSTYRQEGYDE